MYASSFVTCGDNFCDIFALFVCFSEVRYIVLLQPTT